MASTPRFGIGCLKKVDCIQRLNSVWCFTVATALIIFSVYAKFGLFVVLQSSLQQVFSFSTSDITIWYSMFKIGCIISHVFAAYFLAKKNIPKVLSFSTFLVILSFLLHGLPHFFVDYQDKVKVNPESNIAQTLCTLSANNSNGTMFNAAEEDTEALSLQSRVVIILFCAASFVNGLGYAPVYSLGMAFIDNQSKNQKNSGSTIYLAVILSCFYIGPIIGSAVETGLLSVYVTLGDTYLTPSSEQWIGAWWLGFLIFGAISFFVLLLMLMFPKTLSSADNEEEVDYDEKIEMENAESGDDKLRSVKDYLPTLWGLLTNPLYIAQVLAGGVGTYFLAGWYSLLSKHFEEQFEFSAVRAGIYGGVIPPICSIIAILLGGMFVSKYKFTIQQDAKFIFCCMVSATLLIVPMFVLSCQQYPTNPFGLRNTTCHNDCECDSSEYIPLCHEGMSYKSPCLAGCTGHYMQGDEIFYTGCLCERNATIPQGICKDDACYAPYIYLICTTLASAVYVLCAPAAVNLTLRSVSADDKGLALGLQSTLNSLMGWIPAPILFGAVIDSTCTIWEYSDAGGVTQNWKGSCKEYDNKAYQLKVLSVCFATMVVTCLVTAISWRLSYLPRYVTPETVKETIEMPADEPSDDAGT